MSSLTEPSLRVVKSSGDLLDEENTDSQGASESAPGSPAPAESPALAPAVSVSGEIRNDRLLRDKSVPTTTLLGVPAFSAIQHAARHAGPHDTIVDGAPVIDVARLFVLPETAAAIARAKHPTEPTIRIEPFTQSEQERAAAYAKSKAERADAFSKLRSRRPRATPLPQYRADNSNRPQLRSVPAEAPAAPAKWQTFEDLGLAPKPFTKKAQKLVVSTYRLLGFGILTLIVVVLLSYIGTTAFYYLNHTWVTPVALSSNDEKVVALESQRAAQLNERAKLVSDLADAERAIRAEQDFQMQFARAIKKDLEGRKMALGRARELANTAAATRSQVRTTNDDYSSQAATKMAADYDAKLIDRNSMLAGKYQLAQITSANLSLAERQAEFDQRAAELAAQTESLDAILGDKTATAALSYDVLKIARDYDASKLALARELSNRERLKASIERQDKIISGVSSSAYLKAVADHATVALVPYNNLKNVAAGTPLYACRINMIWCRQVGKVLEVLPGEVMVKHPNKDAMVRGRMIEMQLSEEAAAQNEVLFAGGAPLGL